MPPAPFAQALHGRRPPGQERLIIKKALEIVGELLGRGVALGGVLGDRLERDGFQLNRDRLIDACRRPWLFEGDLAKNLLAIAPAIGRLQGKQLVERDAERINVGTVIDDDALGKRLFGTHVAKRAQQVAAEG